MLTFLIILIVLIVICGVGAFASKKSSVSNFFCGTEIILLLTCLVLCSFISIHQSVMESDISEFKIFKSEVKKDFKTQEELLNSHAYKECLEWNTWLSEYKEINKTSRELLVPDKIDKLTRIEIKNK